MLLVICGLRAESPALAVWKDLAAKRSAFSSLQLEYQQAMDVEMKAGKRKETSEIRIEMAGGSWKEETAAAGDRTSRYFNGQQLWIVKDTLGEFETVSPKPGHALPAPVVFEMDHLDWAHAAQPTEQPCASPQFPGVCVLLDIPYREWNENRVRHRNARLAKGYARIFAEKDSGIVLSLRIIELVDHPQFSYRADSTFALRRIQRNPTVVSSTFQAPLDGKKQVKNFTEWTVNLINNRLAGKIAPEIEMRDISGNIVRLSDLRGKIVLLNLWASWCAPCRVDLPALNELQSKYGSKGLQVLGISINEQRTTIEHYLKRFPHQFPTLLTEESAMAAPYWPAAIPTYIVVDREGKIVRATEGREGYGKLKVALEEAGLPTR